MIEKTLLILGALGSIASLIGFLTAVKDQIKLQKILFSIIMLLSIITLFISVRYQNLSNEILEVKNRREAARVEASKLLNKLPSSSAFGSVGENQGSIYAVLSFLESYQDLFPDTYKSYKINVMRKIETLDKSTNQEFYEKQINIAGDTAIQYLQSISE